ncbi:O-antigen polymerase [Spirosoma radiotolerans]|uniref:Oligosaccharide repeat unit polymerase n=1 Tax=Spirosoma radiotolerans TaxID=1379870 RepID=A0A0E3ZSZ6_9BACT|nr:O-antigen polymerase [Spirosoma radiotolerans]AKD53613.1 hypothetical protein SD10_00535 [Spirosoma radiotolerans]
MYPFAASEFNIISTGPVISLIQEYVEKAYILSITGYFFTYIGFYACNNRSLGHKFHRIINTFSLIGEKLITHAIQSKPIILFLSWVLSLTTILGLLYAIAIFGFSFNLRSAFYAENSLLKSFFNLWTALFTNISGFIIIRYLQKREKIFLYIYIFIAVFAIFNGARGTLIIPFLNSFLLYLVGKKNNIKFKYFFYLGSVALFLIFALENLRRVDPVSESFSAIYSFFYGNSFSDVRDFAWILAYWDDNLLLGKSYLSAFMSFIPRSLSEFRSVYAFGVYTDLMVGFDPTLHPGLRPGRFGEIYFNFGVLGIVVLGFLGGYVMRLADIKIKKLATKPRQNYIAMYSTTFLTFFISQFYITAGFWSFYVLILILAGSFLLKRFIEALSLNSSVHH